MRVRIYRCESSYLATWCKDDNGELLAIMPLKSLGRGLLVSVFPWRDEIDRLWELKSEWRPLPYEPCFVTIPRDSMKRLFLEWGFYSEKELLPLEREKVVPLNCLMDYTSDFLNSHKDYCVNLYNLWEIQGGATHHMISQVWPIMDANFKRLLETVKRYLAEIL